MNMAAEVWCPPDETLLTVKRKFVSGPGTATPQEASEEFVKEVRDLLPAATQTLLRALQHEDGAPGGSLSVSELLDPR